MKTVAYFCCGIIVGIAIMAGCRDYGGTDTIARTTVKVDTVTVVDTVFCRLPVAARDSVVVRYRYIEVPIDSCRDSVASVRLPVVSREYSDSDYRAWVSGYCPSLDSIRIVRRETSVMTVKDVSIVSRAPSRWSFGINAGLAVVPSGRLEPYVGIGISYRLWSR